jgi:hypothetical protein
VQDDSPKSTKELLEEYTRLGTTEKHGAADGLRVRGIIAELERRRGKIRKTVWETVLRGHDVTTFLAQLSRCPESNAPGDGEMVNTTTPIAFRTRRAFAPKSDVFRAGAQELTEGLGASPRPHIGVYSRSKESSPRFVASSNPWVCRLRSDFESCGTRPVRRSNLPAPSPARRSFSLQHALGIRLG